MAICMSHTPECGLDRNWRSWPVVGDLKDGSLFGGTDSQAWLRGFEADFEARKQRYRNKSFATGHDGDTFLMGVLGGSAYLK